jgi:hypothetical protein
MSGNPIEDELDAIRIRHYEQTKNMTSEERIAYVNNKAEQILKPYGIKPVYMDITRVAMSEINKDELIKA